MKKLLVLVTFCLFLMPAAALADNVDFSTLNVGGGTGTWSWGGTGFTLSGNSGGLDIFVSSTGGGGVLFDSVLSWTSGASSAGSGSILANFAPGGFIGVSQDTSVCSADCFVGSFLGGQLLDSGAGGLVFESTFVSGDLNPDLLAGLGLPTVPTTYNGVFSVNLIVGTCPTTVGVDSVQPPPNQMCGTFTSADLSLNPAPVPEPGSLALFGTGLLGMAGFLRRKLMSR